MALKALVEKIEDVAEAFRVEYEEIEDGDNAGKFRLKVEDAESLVDVRGLKGALQKANKKARLVDAIRKQFPDATDEEIADLAKQLKELKDKGGSGDDDDADPAKGKDVEKEIQRRLTKAKQEAEQREAELKKQLEETNGRLRKTLLDDQIRKLALEAGVFPEDIDDVVELTRGKRLDLNDEGKLFVKDKDGDPASATPEKFFKEEYKKEKPRFYKATDASGSDAQRSKGGGGGGGKDWESKAPTEWTEEQRREYIEKNGPSSYREKLTDHMRAKVTTTA